MKIHSQKGVALLLMLVGVLTFSAMLVNTYLNNSIDQVKKRHQAHDSKVLLQAKEAVLSYLVDSLIDTDPAKMGRLPCPDSSWSTPAMEGVQNGACNSRYINSVGLLPWKSLDFQPLKDSANECLWYAVAGSYKNNPASELLNWDSPGQFLIEDENGDLFHGTDEGDYPVAVIFAPGPVLSGQDRTAADAAMVHCVGNYDESNYLEAGALIDYSVNHETTTEDAVWRYLYASKQARRTEDDFNDQMVWITADEVWERVQQHRLLEIQNTSEAAVSELENLTRGIAECFALYANHAPASQFKLPYAAGVALLNFRHDGFHHDYYYEGTQNGRVPIDVRTSNGVIDPGGVNFSTADLRIACVNQGVLTDEQVDLWMNWKDQFFYSVSTEFLADYSPVQPLAARCAGGGAPSSAPASENTCIWHYESGRNLAAMIILAGPADDLENELRYSEADKSVVGNYLDGSNVAGFANSNQVAFETFETSDIALSGSAEYAYCLYIDTAVPELVAVACEDVP